MMAVTTAEGTNILAAEMMPLRQSLGKALHNFIRAPAPACTSFGCAKWSRPPKEEDAPGSTWSSFASYRIE